MNRFLPLGIKFDVLRFMIRFLCCCVCFLLVRPSSAQFTSITLAPKINLGYFFPTQVSVLQGENFMNPTNIFPPMFLGQVITQDGSIRTALLQHGGYGVETFFHFDRAPEEHNWSIGGSVFLQKHLYSLDIPDFDFKGSRSSAIIDYYRYAAYKLSLRKSWHSTAREREYHVQVSGVYTNNFKIYDNRWMRPDELVFADYTDNGTGYTVTNFDVIKENFMAEIAIGTRFRNIPLFYNISCAIPFNQYIFKSKITFYDAAVPRGTMMTKESQLAVWINLSYEFELGHWTKKPKTPKPKPIEPVLADKRRFTVQETYTTKSDHVVIEVFDNASADGDTASIDFNGERILENYAVDKTPKQLELDLKEGENIIALFAESLGTTPPNTAAIAIIDGETRKVFVLNSDYSRSGALKIIRE